jgi:hypothetical protein
VKIRAHYRDRVTVLPARSIKLGQLPGQSDVGMTLYLEAASREGRAFLEAAAGGPVELRTPAPAARHDVGPAELVIRIPYFRGATEYDYREHPSLPRGAYLARDAWLGREQLAQHA